VSALETKAIGCLAGAAVGDALGSATEGWSHEQIRQRYRGSVSGIVPPYTDGRPDLPDITRYQKGNGRITDDTLMTLALVDVYDRERRHLGAYDVAEYLVPLLMNSVRWIPDMEREDTLMQRLFLAEKWLVARLHHGHADPREAGTGNIVNCGAAMYMAPVGIANAADPEGAYAEAIDIAGAHQSSYGREAAGVFAAAVAAAMARDATVDDVVGASLAVAHDGTKAAIEAVVHRARQVDDVDVVARELREAVAAFDTVGEDYRKPGLGARRPSRLHSIEELPIAIGLLIVASGDYRDAVIGAVNYGRDADSIGTMTGALAGALRGRDAVPTAWREHVARESRVDLEAPGATMAEVSAEIFARDRHRQSTREEAFRRLSAEEVHARHPGPA
jgi:ADP-ribosylglycohydrolase